MKKDNIVWTSVSDLTGRKGNYPVLYDVSALPVNYFLDPKGVIIDKYLNGHDLLKKLENTLSK